MLKQRLLTALMLVPVVLLTLYYSSPVVLFYLVLGVLLLLGGEWASLIPIRSSKWAYKKIFFVVALLALTAFCLRWFEIWLCVGLLMWVILAVFIATYPKSQALWSHRAVVAVWGGIELPLFVVSILMLMHRVPQGRALFIYLLFLVWAADSGAYFAGKRFGRHRLIPHVSPGKTIEGLVGGFALSLVVGGIGWFLFHPTKTMAWFLLALGVVLISMVGDLFISMLKRRCQLKDTGTLLPGHGGVLDRLDSLIAAVPWFYVGQYYWLHDAMVL